MRLVVRKKPNKIVLTWFGVRNRQVWLQSCTQSDDDGREQSGFACHHGNDGDKKIERCEWGQIETEAHGRRQLRRHRANANCGGTNHVWLVWLNHTAYDPEMEYSDLRLLMG